MGLGVEQRGIGLGEGARAKAEDGQNAVAADGQVQGRGLVGEEAVLGVHGKALVYPGRLVADSALRGLTHDDVSDLVPDDVQGLGITGDQGGVGVNDFTQGRGIVGVGRDAAIGQDGGAHVGRGVVGPDLDREPHLRFEDAAHAVDSLNRRRQQGAVGLVGAAVEVDRDVAIGD